jgi:hypothetical protein
MAADARFHVGIEHAECGHVTVVCIRVAIGDIHGRDALDLGEGDDLVVDIGDVAHILHAQPLLAQEAHHNVRHQRRPRIAHMAQSVHRGAAAVDAAAAGVAQDQFPLGTREGVVDVDRLRQSLAHRGSRRPARAGPPCRWWKVVAT